MELDVTCHLRTDSAVEERRGRRVVAVGEGQEGVGPMRGVVMPGPVLPHSPALVPLFAVRPKPPQAEIAALLVELAARKGRPRRRDRLPQAMVSLSAPDQLKWRCCTDPHGRTWIPA